MPRLAVQAHPIRLCQKPPRKPRNSARLAAWSALGALCWPALASAGPLPLTTFAQLAASCAPHVAVETLAAVARTESGFDVLTLHDNSTGRSYHPATREDAIALGVELATVGRHSVDFGLMQINGAHLARMGLTLADAFDPCRNLAAADRVLVDGYTAPAPGQDPQPAVQQALSRYNTGDASRGVSNGYVGRVQASAELVVPALRLRSEAAPDQPGPLGGGAPVTAQPLPLPPASWDVYGQAKASRGQGVVVFGASPLPPPAPAAAALPAPVQAPASPPPGGPVPLRRLQNVEAMNDAR
jgi:type IV secretion system protein VirB1